MNMKKREKKGDVRIFVYCSFELPSSPSSSEFKVSSPSTNSHSANATGVDMLVFTGRLTDKWALNQYVGAYIQW